MTAIIGIVDELSDCVWLGSDSGTWNSGDDTTELVPYTKLFAASNGLNDVPVAVAFTGNLRHCQILKHAIIGNLTSSPHRIDVDRWLALDFYNIVHDAFVQYGVLKGDEPFDMGRSGFLIGIGKRLFSVDTCFEIVEATRGYDAMGSARALCLGSLFTSQITEPPDPQMFMYRALCAAQEHLPEIKPPFMCLNTRGRRYMNLNDVYDDVPHPA